jgi:adenylosuccinate synthase
MEFHAVIGSGYGDEGKGTVTARIAANARGQVLNILTNGGAQRGHTVQFSDGKSFTNKHFGSATYLHAANYFAASFILDPMQFKVEYYNYPIGFSFYGFFRNKACRWITPFDIMANQAEAKIEDLHNTCGMGIWKTIQRYSTTGFNKSFDEFLVLEFDQKIKYLEGIATYYEHTPRFDCWPAEYKVFFDDKLMLSNLISHFIADCEFMGIHTTPVDSLTKEKGFLSEKCLLEDFDRIIFENGQGLAIGDNGTDDKFATPSKTGFGALPVDLLNWIRSKNISLNLHYVSRTYETRHGDDDAFGKVDRRSLSSYIKEDTNNHYNMWQGEFKYKPLDVGQLNSRIAKDLKGVINTDVYLDLTHCDEIGPEGIVCPGAIINCSDSPIVQM